MQANRIVYRRVENSEKQGRRSLVNRHIQARTCQKKGNQEAVYVEIRMSRLSYAAEQRFQPMRMLQPICLHFASFI